MKNLTVSIIIVICGTSAITSCTQDKAPQKKTYSMGKLQGRTLSGLYSRYLGTKEKTTIDKNLTIDFQKTFMDLWVHKKRRCSSPVVSLACKQQITEYKKKQTHTSFMAYQSHIIVVIEKLKKNINWKNLKNNLKLSQSDADLVKKISLSFNGKDMTAYIMTELMPSSDGKLNVLMLDFLLRNAGKEYVEGIPALYDDKVSFGPYQFTEYAVFCTSSENRGASVINQSVRKDLKIPGSVIHLRGDYHHRAAYLFAVYNITLMIKSLDEKQKKVLNQSWRKNRDDLFLYCAVAHHNPAAARRAARKWLDNYAVAPFESSCRNRIVGYAEKTRKNLAAM